ncbi:hypothetical protein AB0N24_04525 [Arthrobacter sp. NPDC093128]|uniref:hypothetical protein n=1 Tax=Arthrobacter sp. NPDC093128 TaxID=3154979 RepID=UPI003432E9D6
MARATHSKVSVREAQAMKIRRGIRAAQLRVALDNERGRQTPEAVIRLSNLKLPEVTTIAVKTPPTRERHSTSR